MFKKSDRTVYKTTDGWANKRNSASRPANTHKTQKEAIQAAKGNLENAGGGELTVMGRDGKIRSKDTIGGGNDPLPPRDTEH